MSLYMSSRAPARRVTRTSGEVPLLMAHLRFFGDRGGLAPMVKNIEELEKAMRSGGDHASPLKGETSKILPALRVRFKTPGCRVALDRVQMWAEGLGEDGRKMWLEILWDIELPYM